MNSLKCSFIPPVVIASSLLAACAATVGARFDECWKIIKGEIDINVLGNSATVAGFCIERKHSFCKELVDVRAEWFVDINNNGTRDPGEPHDYDFAANPGEKFCQGETVVNSITQYAGATVRWSVEASEQDANGNKTLITSKSGDHKIPG